nr:ATP-binding protein [Nitrosopumilus sp.]
MKNKHETDSKKILIPLILSLVGFTALYQLRPFLSDFEFSYVSFPAYTIVPAVLVGFASFITIKLYRRNHFQVKAFLMFTLGTVCWFVAEQIWQAYDYFWDGEPFPSEADIFYIASYPLFTAFLFLSLKPILSSVSRNVWLFAIGLSVSFLVPSVAAAYDDIYGESSFAVSIALAYPIMASVQLIPAIVGVLFLAKKGANFSWMLLLFGFIVYAIADTFFLLAQIDGSYYDGHPVDVMYIYTFLLCIFAIQSRLTSLKHDPNEEKTFFFTEHVKFETISKFGIPLTVAIVCMVILISLIDAVMLQTGEELSIESLMLGIVGMLAVFGVIVITINKNLSRLVQMRTKELTEQRDNLENLVEEKTEELLKSERLSAIGELSGRLAHDLRNPLSVIKMSVDLLKQSNAQSKSPDESFEKRVGLIEKSVERISHQVDDVLGYVRISPLKISAVNVYDLIQNSVEKINIPDDIQMNIPKNEIKLDCDPLKLDPVFINLIVNAIQAMPEGGEIKIIVSESHDSVILDFVDSGIGIPEKDLDKVFEPLFTTKQKGTGLGLASCKNIVEQHEGTISVSNEPTTFRIILPKNLG